MNFTNVTRMRYMCLQVTKIPYFTGKIEKYKANPIKMVHEHILVLGDSTSC